MEGAPEPGFSDAVLAPYTVRGPVLGQCFRGHQGELGAVGLGLEKVLEEVVAK